MTADRPTVVFMGSGPVAARSLELLLEWCDVEVVITKPKPPHHKYDFPVISLAEQRQLPLLYASNHRELDSLVANQAVQSRACILIDFGIIVSQTVIDYFPLGIINSHFSLLPDWRGADPISFALLSGQPQTGVSLMLLVEAMDEGPILAQGVQEIDPTDTTPSLTKKLIALSDDLLYDVVPLYLSGRPHPQTGQPIEAVSQQAAAGLAGRSYRPSYSRKLTKQDGQLDFSKPAVVLAREVRAFTGWPTSYTVLAGKAVTIVEATTADTPAERANAKPGTPYTMADKRIGIVTTDGTLAISRLKPAGKTAMDAAAFLAGNKL